MNKKYTSSKDISRTSVKKLSQKHIQPLPDKDFPRRSSRSNRATTSAAPKDKTVQKHFSKPPKLPTDDHSDSSIDSSDCPKRTSDLKQQILDSLETFKLASNELCGLSSQFTEDFSTFHKEFYYMKNEIQTVLNESGKSLQELSKVKSQLLESPYQHINLSTKNSPGTVSETLEAAFEDPQDKIFTLRKQVQDLKEDMKKNEKELVLNETENEELRDKAYKLQDTFGDMSGEEVETKSAACKTCSLF